jgi:hypothetical protein
MEVSLRVLCINVGGLPLSRTRVCWSHFALWYLAIISTLCCLIDIVLGMAKAVADTNVDNQAGFASDSTLVSGFSHMHDSGTGGVCQDLHSTYPRTEIRTPIVEEQGPLFSLSVPFTRTFTSSHSLHFLLTSHDQ